ncbi:MAG: acetylglucosamine transferase [Candidatus Dactylopiibacterium sp.]|nr:acetylglucosamine transferase [Candidatus Dactylopiibacterium sp.]
MSADHARTLFLQALAALEREDYAHAADVLQQAHAILPERVSILVNLAAARLKLGDAAEAARLSLLALAHEPANTAALLNLAESRLALDEAEQALACCRQLLALAPDAADARVLHAATLIRLGRAEEGLREADAVLAQTGRHAEAAIQRAAALRTLGRAAEALQAARLACEWAPALQGAWIAQGNARHALHDHAGALAAFARANAIRPSSEAWLGCCAVRHDEQDYAAALAACDAALALRENSDALNARAQLLLRMKRVGEAIASLDRACALRPAHPAQRQARVLLRQHACDWQHFEADVAERLRGLAAGEDVADPFAFLSLPASAAQQRRCAELHVAHALPVVTRADARPAPGGRLRVGYFSADFHNHATAWLMARVFELHDRDRVETFAFSFGPRTGDAMQQRLRGAFAHFHEIHGLSDAEAAAFARAQGLDIAVDLKGFTTDARPAIFAHGAAPVQVNHLGYPGTLGTPCFDYLIADAVVIPPGAEGDYSERIVRLPHCYQPNDALREVDPHTPTRASLGLPEEGFVFCCFNNNYKITPDVFGIWMRLLAQTPASVLWLLEDNPDAARNLRAHATAAGIAAERLVFARRTTMPAHLARQRRADLFLDTFHYNAHTTASDALWVGLPVLTCAGASFPARVAASLLHATDLPELVTTSPEAYAALALQLAHAPQRLAAVRARLAAAIPRAPLFDSATFTRHLEAAYAAMHARALQGLAPADITIAA